jgi:hypothetical protein
MLNHYSAVFTDLKTRLFELQGVLYVSVGFVCGIIGQGIANMIMTAKR